MARAAAVWGLALACLLAGSGAVHHEGDFIHTSRRTQFLRKRTQWRDLIEHHCPRFGQTRIVALPISKPEAEEAEVTDYRIQLSFDGDRVLTPWLTVLGKSMDGMPLVEVTLRRAGDELKGVRARVVPLPDELLMRHEVLFREYQNTTHWPKHVLVHYAFHDEGDIDFNKGLCVMTATALSLFVLLSINTLAGVQAKVGQLLKDVVGAEADPLLGPSDSSAAGGGMRAPPPYIPFKGGAHVE